MKQIILEQATVNKNEEPSVKFLLKLQALLDSGKAVTLPKDADNQQKPIGLIGYEDSQYYYLISNIVHSMVKKLCDEQGESFPIDVRTLLRHLAEDKVIEISKSSNTRVVKIRGKATRLMVLPKAKIENASY